MEEQSKLHQDDDWAKLAKVEEVFKLVFTRALYVSTRQVRAGGTSSTVYVPKKFRDNPVTVIVWEKPELPKIP